MNRRYDTALYREKVANIRAAFGEAVALTTDIIVGFPGETDDEFAQTLNFAEEMTFAKIHVFTYSPRKGTIASEMSAQVAPSVKKSRYAALSAIAGAGVKVEELGV